MSGTHRSEIQSLPGCKLDKKDERHAYHMVGAQVRVVVDPNDPNHLVGEKVIPGQTGKTVITWNLTRGEGEGESFLP